MKKSTMNVSGLCMGEAVETPVPVGRIAASAALVAITFAAVDLIKGAVERKLGVPQFPEVEVRVDPKEGSLIIRDGAAAAVAKEKAAAAKAEKETAEEKAEEEDKPEDKTAAKKTAAKKTAAKKTAAEKA